MIRQCHVVHFVREDRTLEFGKGLSDASMITLHRRALVPFPPRQKNIPRIRSLGFEIVVFPPSGNLVDSLLAQENALARRCRYLVICHGILIMLGG